jgi:hypothetical protein
MTTNEPLLTEGEAAASCGSALRQCGAGDVRGVDPFSGNSGGQCATAEMTWRISWHRPAKCLLGRPVPLFETRTTEKGRP